MSIATSISTVSHRSLRHKSKYELASWVLTLLDTNTRQHALLLKVAPSHQGGHSDTGAALAEYFGIHFPVNVDDLIKVALHSELDPHELWPWLVSMRSGREKPLPHAPIESDPKLIALLKQASLHTMKPHEIAEQRRSWVIGELMLENADLTRDEAEARYDAVMAGRTP